MLGQMHSLQEIYLEDNNELEVCLLLHHYAHGQQLSMYQKSLVLPSVMFWFVRCVS